jgi:S-formylglutathione hydrolase FrmB
MHCKVPRPLITAIVAILLFGNVPRAEQQAATLRFEVSVAPELGSQPHSGRLFVLLGRAARPEPRQVAEWSVGLNGLPMFARDVTGLTPQNAGVIDQQCAAFPVNSLSEITPGTYFVQAVLDSSLDLKSLNSPGNLYSRLQRLDLDPRRSGIVKLQLTEQIGPEQLPAETAYFKYVKLQSQLLSKFWGRPIYLRAAIILPRDYEREPERRYPVRVHIGGYGTRYTQVQLPAAWLADDAPRMILIHLDGAGPYGDPYQVNSENNGPYGDAITQELIPYIEKKYRGIGQGSARVLDGGSTGGWVSLALQIFYPDYFNGAWSSCPDGVDFRGFQLVNIYQDKNAYLNAYGFERPGARDINGDVRYTMRYECQKENVLGRGDSWTMSGGQWGAWNAAYGPRGKDGLPVPLWDPKTGAINRDAAEHWKKYDLRLVLEQNWNVLGPKLRGKLRIWVGEADDYFLNNAVHMLDAFLQRANPPYEGRIVYGPGKGHCWMGLTERQVMDEMITVVRRP